MDVQEGTAFFPGSQLAGQGLLVSDGDTWRRQRQLANPAFRRSAVASYGAVRPAACPAPGPRFWVISARYACPATLLRACRMAPPGPGAAACAALARGALAAPVSAALGGRIHATWLAGTSDSAIC